MTNNIVVGHSTGIYADGSPPTVTVEASYTLFHDNAVGDTNAAVSSINPIYGSPSFVNPESWNYHICEESAARDTGTDTWVCYDADGNLRPWGTKPDVGAYEFGIFFKVYLPMMLKSDL